MALLPESDLVGAPDVDHAPHHEEVHTLHNRLITTTDVEIGDVPRRTALTETPNSVAYRSVGYTHAQQVLTVTHSVAGALDITVTRSTKVVKVSATADIVGIGVTGITTLGEGYASFQVILTAGAAISVAFPGSTLHGTPPSSMASGESTIFDYIDDNPT